jgi:hypothetical protein
MGSGGGMHAAHAASRAPPPHLCPSQQWHVAGLDQGLGVHELQARRHSETDVQAQQGGATHCMACEGMWGHVGACGTCGTCGGMQI